MKTPDNTKKKVFQNRRDTMTKPYYADYINRMLRFYSRKGPVYKTNIDEINYKCVDKVLGKLNPSDKELIIDIYKRGDTLADNIYQVSKEKNINQEKLWTIVNKISKAIARERRLI